MGERAVQVSVEVQRRLLQARRGSLSAVFKEPETIAHSNNNTLYLHILIEFIHDVTTCGQSFVLFVTAGPSSLAPGQLLDRLLRDPIDLCLLPLLLSSHEISIACLSNSSAYGFFAPNCCCMNSIPRLTLPRLSLT